MGDSYKLPEGWTAEPCTHGKGEHLMIKMPYPGGMVTVDWKNRCYRLGHSTFGSNKRPKEELKGRGWQQKLVDAAVEGLKDVYK